MTDITHSELVEKASKWLGAANRCPVVFTETSVGNEIVDVIGWKYGGWSVMLECKVSLIDLKADRKKPARICPETGVGDEKWYVIPVGILEKARVEIIKNSNYQDRFGLLVLKPKGFSVEWYPWRSAFHKGKSQPVSIKTHPVHHREALALMTGYRKLRGDFDQTHGAPMTHKTITEKDVAESPEHWADMLNRNYKEIKRLRYALEKITLTEFSSDPNYAKDIAIKTLSLGCSNDA